MRNALRFATQGLIVIGIAFAGAMILAPFATAQDYAYPPAGFDVATLPPGYVTVHQFDGDYYFHAGVWYRNIGPHYFVVEPPLGGVVPVLPPAYTALWAGAVPYYYANGAYYAAAPGGYAVVAPPGAASLTPPRQASALDWFYCDSAQVYYPYVQECAEGWRAVEERPADPTDAMRRDTRW